MRLQLQLSASEVLVDSSTKKGTYRAFYQGTSRANNTSYTLQLKWKKAWSNLKLTTHVTTMGGDPNALASFFPLAVKQQLELEHKKRDPYQNPRKSFGAFMLRNVVSSTWAVHYLMDRNPLISRRYRKYVYMQAGLFGEWPTFIQLGFCVFEPTKENWSLLAVFYGLSWFWKLMLIVHNADIQDYNTIADSPYNLKQISDEY